MAYSTDELIRMMTSGIVDPATMLGMQDQQFAAQNERRQLRRARKAERQGSLEEMLMGLQTAAYEGATEGTPLETLLANPAVSQAAGALGQDTLSSVLEPYYRASGVSRLNPTLSQEQASDISRLVAEEYSASGGMFDPSTFFNNVMTELPPKVAPQVSKLISDTLNQLKPRY